MTHTLWHPVEATVHKIYLKQSTPYEAPNQRMEKGVLWVCFKIRCVSKIKEQNHNSWTWCSKDFFFLKNMKNLFLCKGIPKSSFNLNGRPSRTQSRDVLKGNLGKFWKAHWRNPLKIFRWHFKTLKKAFQILLMKMGSLNHLSSLRSA